MRYKLAGFLMVLGCGGVVTQDSPAKKYVSSEGGFAVRFPVGIEVKSKTIAGAGGVERTAHLANDNGKEYGVTYMTLPEDFLKAGPDAILNGTTKSLTVKSSDAEATTKSITFGQEKYPGREVVIYHGGKAIRNQAFVVDRKMYVLSVIGAKDAVYGKAAGDFLDSFELVK
jgi:hypothetical protein